MKKVALISYHNEPNYGTMLQAYALYKVIYKLGFQSEYISYTSQPFGWLRFYFQFMNVIRHPSYLLNRILKKSVRKNEFSFFKTDEFKNIMDAYTKWYQQYIPHTSIIYTHQNISFLEEQYDSFIVGSDQTWSPYRNEKYPSFYFNYLMFVNDNNKKNAYAPSFGTLSLSSEYCNKIRKQLKTFKHLSCRERTNSDYLSEKHSLPITTVLDPTLLLNSNEWDEVSNHIQMPSKYILCYILGEKESISKFAEKLGKEQGIPVFYILTRPYYLGKKNLLNNVGPGEFLSLICNASYVCTDSFHGTIFSINYNVPFYSFTKRESTENINDNDRIKEILSEFNLLDRFREDNNFNTAIKAIDFYSINKQLESKRSISNNYIRSLFNV